MVFDLGLVDDLVIWSKDIEDEYCSQRYAGHEKDLGQYGVGGQCAVVVIEYFLDFGVEGRHDWKWKVVLENWNGMSNDEEG